MRVGGKDVTLGDGRSERNGFDMTICNHWQLKYRMHQSDTRMTDWFYIRRGRVRNVVTKAGTLYAEHLRSVLLLHDSVEHLTNKAKRGL